MTIELLRQLRMQLRKGQMHPKGKIYLTFFHSLKLDEYQLKLLSADKRWKGEHDCKNYLSSYSECLQKADMSTKLNIRFWLDVPIKTKERRKLEQQLIKAWLPPFNKETREIWATPFTSPIN